MTTTVPLSDRRITESSSLAVSKKFLDIAYTINDEPTKPHIFIVRISTGRTVGTITLKGVALVDPEALDVSGAGNITLGDIGDNKNTRKEIAVYVFAEPETPSGDHTVKASRYRVQYPDKKSRNAETLIVSRATSEKFIMSKQDDRTLIFKLPNKMSVLRVNKLIAAGSLPLSLVTDGSFIGQRFAVFRQKGLTSTAAIVDWAERRVVVKKLAVKAVKQPESVSVEWDARNMIYGSEGVNSPLNRQTVPAEYR